MKKIIMFPAILTLMLTTQIVAGQQQEGVITFEVRVNLHRTIPPDRQGMKAMVPEFRTFKEQLFFTAGESLYKPLIEDEDEDDQPAGGGGRRNRFMQQRNQVYFNQTSGKLVTMQEFMGKTYLIDDSVKVAPWKLGTDTKTVQGFVCKQAYYTDEERKQTITAWYSDQLRPLLGPDRFNTLPGAVLAVDINNGERVTVATKIEFRALKKNELQEPIKGEKTTQAEFRKMVDEQRKQMRSRGGSIRN